MTYMNLERLSAILMAVGIWVLSILICVPSMLNVQTDACKSDLEDYQWLVSIEY